MVMSLINVLRVMFMSLINVLRPCDLSEQAITRTQKSQAPPKKYQNPHT